MALDLGKNGLIPIPFPRCTINPRLQQRHFLHVKETTSPGPEFHVLTKLWQWSLYVLLSGQTQINGGIDIDEWGQAARNQAADSVSPHDATWHTRHVSWQNNAISTFSDTRQFELPTEIRRLVHISAEPFSKFMCPLLCLQFSKQTLYTVKQYW